MTPTETQVKEHLNHCLAKLSKRKPMPNSCTKAERLRQFIYLIVEAGKQDDLSDQGICTLALDLDRYATFLFHRDQFTISFSDDSQATFDQVPDFAKEIA